MTVKFAEDLDDPKLHEGGIRMEKVDDDTVICNIGFLQCYHEYAIELKLPIELTGFERTGEHQSLLGLQISQATPQDGGYMVRFSARVTDLKGLLEDTVEFTNGITSKKIVIRANILGDEEGTPYLKSGIKMTAPISNPSVVGSP